VKMTDSTNNPFIAASWGDLLVQGNQGVEISALSHPESGLFAGKDLVLRSDENVLGDAHFWSGGRFQVEKLDGSLGGLNSPNDPIIFANGDVDFGSYQGASLHILAGGRVRINYVNITGADGSGNAINPNAAPLLANVTLSDGTPLVIDGTRQPTLDIRAGIDWNKLGGSPGTFGIGNFPSFFSSNNPTNADIRIDEVVVSAPRGLVFLSNQFQSNESLNNGNISIGWIDGTSQVGNGSTVIIDSKSNLIVPVKGFSPADYYIDTSSETGSGGNIKLIVNNDISLIGSSIRSNSSLGEGSSIDIKARSLTLQNGEISVFNKDSSGGITNIQATEKISLDNGSLLFRQTVGKGSSGDVIINTPKLSLDDKSFLNGNTSSSGSAGNVTINTNNLTIKGGSQISSSTFDIGKGGRVLIQPLGVSKLNIELDGKGSGIFSQADPGTETRPRAEGDAGSLLIKTEKLSLNNQAIISTAAGGNSKVNVDPNAGNISINASDIILNDESVISSETFGNKKAGDLTINTNTITVEGGSKILSNSYNSGNTGKLYIEANNYVEVIGRSSNNNNPSTIQSSVGGSGNGQGVTFKTNRLTIKDGAFVFSGVFRNGTGNGGQITINSDDVVEVIGSGKNDNQRSALSSQTQGYGNAGNMIINTPKLSIKNGGIVQSAALTGSTGNAGDLTVNASYIELLGQTPNGGRSLLNANTSGVGNAGNLTINTTILSLQNSSQVASSTFNQGKGGNLSIKASESIQIDGFESGIYAQSLPVSRGSTDNILQGNAGDIFIQSPNIFLDNQSIISVATSTEGNAGNLNIRAETLSLDRKSGFSAVTLDSGNGGSIDIQASSLSLTNSSQISSRGASNGKAGNINLNIAQDIQATDSDIRTSSDRSSGGAINITASNIRLFGDSDIRTNVNSGADNGGNITLNADSIIAFDDSDVVAFARDGKGGDITFNTPVFFGDGFRPAPKGTQPDTLDNNGVVDINASGATSGIISLPNLDFVRNSITDLPENVVDTDTIIANSCVVANPQETGSFLITGSGGLPLRPGDATVSDYPTGKVRAIPESNSSNQQVIEPQGVYRLADGTLVLSRRCE
jgi:large exoprotein involved in heme utilization and adhesion